mgnify:CR=1 FL=1
MAKSAAVLTPHERDRQTVRTVAGVRIAPGHWASTVVHAHRTWTGEHAMLTWCGLTADLEAGARQTTDTINCLQCAEASWRTVRELTS